MFIVRGAAIKQMSAVTNHRPVSVVWLMFEAPSATSRSQNSTSAAVLLSWL